MRVVDFTHVLRREMPVYPGTPLPELTVASTWERDGFHETRLTLHSHTGSHMDAPAHLFPAGATLDALPPARFAGTALVVPCAGAGAVLHMDLLAPVKAAADRADFLLFHTGWDRLWGQAAYFEGYPVPGEDVVDYLLASGKKGVGLDTVSVDPVGDWDLPIHRRLLGGGLVIVENLTNLAAAGGEPFTFCALPLHYEKADGAPVRAVGLWL